MSTITENDLKRLEDLIIASREESRQQFTSLEQRFTSVEQRLTTIEAGMTIIPKIETAMTTIQKDVTELRSSLSKIEGSLQSQQPLVLKIPDLAEKVGELKNWRQLFIITLTASISGVIGWLIRDGNLRP